MTAERYILDMVNTVTFKTPEGKPVKWPEDKVDYLVYFENGKYYYHGEYKGWKVYFVWDKATDVDPYL